jgi:hypothetical protein
MLRKRAERVEIKNAASLANTKPSKSTGEMTKSKIGSLSPLLYTRELIQTWVRMDYGVKRHVRPLTSASSLYRNPSPRGIQQNYWPTTIKATNSSFNTMTARSFDLHCDALTEGTGKTNMSVVGFKTGLHGRIGIARVAF